MIFLAILDEKGEYIKTVKCCQYVDDCCTINNGLNEVDECLELMDDFGKASGSKINKTKTIGMSNIVEGHSSSGITITTKPEIMLGIPVGKKQILEIFGIKN